MDYMTVKEIAKALDFCINDRGLCKDCLFSDGNHERECRAVRYCNPLIKDCLFYMIEEYEAERDRYDRLTDFELAEAKELAELKEQKDG